MLQLSSNPCIDGHNHCVRHCHTEQSCLKRDCCVFVTVRPGNQKYSLLHCALTVFGMALGDTAAKLYCAHLREGALPFWYLAGSDGHAGESQRGMTSMNRWWRLHCTSDVGSFDPLCCWTVLRPSLHRLSEVCVAIKMCRMLRNDQHSPCFFVHHASTVGLLPECCICLFIFQLAAWVCLAYCCLSWCSTIGSVGDRLYDAERGEHATNTWLEGRCLCIGSSLGAQQVVVKQPRILWLNQSNSSAMKSC